MKPTTLTVWRELERRVRHATDTPTLGREDLAHAVAVLTETLDEAVNELLAAGALLEANASHLGATSQFKQVGGVFFYGSGGSNERFLRLVGVSSFAAGLRAKRLMLECELSPNAKTEVPKPSHQAWAPAASRTARGESKRAPEPLPPYVSPLVVLEQVARAIAPDCNSQTIVDAMLAAGIKRARDQVSDSMDDDLPATMPASAYTARNLQLLCERCNRTKGDRI
jgi:hypothetical protein